METKILTTYNDTRGFFREIIRENDPLFREGFGQWSHSLMYTGTIKAWHYHRVQTDLWYIAAGVVLAAVCKLKYGSLGPSQNSEVFEFILGDGQEAKLLRIPPNWAHGLKVLQGPAHLLYITSHIYNPEDEHRIAYNDLGYDWDKRDIR
jgi:dTDP-4-dehydrorhamnose 3,5-epimerase